MRGGSRYTCPPPGPPGTSHLLNWPRGHIPTGARGGKTCNYLSMSIAISEEHRALAQTVADLLTKHQSRAAARSLLEGGTEQLPAFWAELSGLGLLGLHVPEELGGSGFGLAGTAVRAER